jgi:hypothetical protein
MSFYHLVYYVAMVMVNVNLGVSFSAPLRNSKITSGHDISQF